MQKLGWYAFQRFFRNFGRRKVSVDPQAGLTSAQLKKSAATLDEIIQKTISDQPEPSRSLIRDELRRRDTI